MTSLIPETRRPGVGTSLGNHEARIRAVERNATGIRFNTDNEGGWLYVQINDTVDLDTLPDPLNVGGIWGGAIEEASGSGLLIGSTDELLLKGDNVNVLAGNAVDVFSNGGGESHETNTGSFDVDTGGGGMTLDSVGGGTLIKSGGGGLEINSQDGGLDIISGAGNILLNTGSSDQQVLLEPTALTLKSFAGGIGFLVGAGLKITFLDHLGNPKIQWTEGTADLHIPVGGTVIASL